MAEGRLHEVRFEDLVADPIGEMRRLYRALGLPPFEVVEQRVVAYLDTLRDYERNRFAPLEPEMKARVAYSWKRYFDEYGYAP